MVCLVISRYIYLGGGGVINLEMEKDAGERTSVYSCCDLSDNGN